MQHFKLEIWWIRGFVFWCHEHVNSLFCPRKIIRGQSIEIQPRTFFDLDDLKNSFSYYFENSSLKSTHFFRGIMWDIYKSFWGITVDPNLSSRHKWRTIYVMLGLRNNRYKFPPAPVPNRLAFLKHGRLMLSRNTIKSLTDIFPV